VQVAHPRPSAPLAPSRKRRAVGAVPTVASLVEAARGGSAPAFEQLYRALAGQVSAYLRWHRATDPDGLTNDVFTQVHRNLSRFRGDEQGFRSWVFTIAHHRMIDDRRRASRMPRLEDDTAVEEHMGTGDVEDDVLAWLAHDRVRDLLAVLSRDQREVLLLRIVADLPVDEVARILDKREGAIKALQHRALNALRRHIDRHPVGA
jgi:RNA polymerase sigma factor (sigma-70 family)